MLALISNNGSHPRTTDLFEVNRQVLCVYVSEWPDHVRSDSLSRVFFSVDSEDELGQCCHITPHEFVVSNKRAWTSQDKTHQLAGWQGQGKTKLVWITEGTQSRNITWHPRLQKKKNLRQDPPSVFTHPRFSFQLSTFSPSNERLGLEYYFFWWFIWMVVHRGETSSMIYHWKHFLKRDPRTSTPWCHQAQDNKLILIILPFLITAKWQHLRIILLRPYHTPLALGLL